MQHCNPIIAELKALAELPCNPGQHAFFERRYRDARPVECVPMAEVFTPEQMEFLRCNYRPKPKMCYKNATQLVQLVSHPLAFLFSEPAEYVEGYVYDPVLIPIEHAFVKVGDKYIDPTFERALRIDVTKCYYCSIIEVDWPKLAEIMAETQIYGEIYRALYVRGLQAGKQANTGK